MSARLGALRNLLPLVPIPGVQANLRTLEEPQTVAALNVLLRRAQHRPGAGAVAGSTGHPSRVRPEAGPLVLWGQEAGSVTLGTHATWVDLQAAATYLEGRIVPRGVALPDPVCSPWEISANLNDCQFSATEMLAAYSRAAGGVSLTPLDDERPGIQIGAGPAAHILRYPFNRPELPGAVRRYMESR